MSPEDFMKLMIRTQYREEKDLTPPKTLTDKEREMWNKEARVIEGERK